RQTWAASAYDAVATALVAGPPLSAIVGAGGHGITRADGQIVIVHGNRQLVTTIYDPAGGTTSAGPALPPGTMIWNGALSFARCDGQFVVFHGGDVAASYLFDP